MYPHFILIAQLLFQTKIIAKKLIQHSVPHFSLENLFLKIRRISITTSTIEISFITILSICLSKCFVHVTHKDCNIQRCKVQKEYSVTMLNIGSTRDILNVWCEVRMLLTFPVTKRIFNSVHWSQFVHHTFCYLLLYLKIVVVKSILFIHRGQWDRTTRIFDCKILNKSTNDDGK